MFKNNWPIFTVAICLVLLSWQTRSGFATGALFLLLPTLGKISDEDRVKKGKEPYGYGLAGKGLKSPEDGDKFMYSLGLAVILAQLFYSLYNNAVSAG